MPGPLHVAWINEGHVTEDDWTAAHGRAHHAVKARFGTAVETTWVQKVALEDAHEAIADVVASGVDLVLATSQALEPHVIEIAKRNPSVLFEQARGRQVLHNVSTFSGAHEDAVHLVGMAAGFCTSSGIVGFVATRPEPETIRHINAYALGCLRARPDTEIHVQWTGTWWSPDNERAAALHLIDQGADILATGSISPAVGEVARDRYIPWSSHDSDLSQLDPGGWLTASTTDWSGHIANRVAAALGGTWQPIAYYGGLADGFTRLLPVSHRVPGLMRALINGRLADLRSGAADVFAGPIRDQTGGERVSAGQRFGLTGRLGMDWFVEGVVGSTEIAAV